VRQVEAELLLIFSAIFIKPVTDAIGRTLHAANTRCASAHLARSIICRSKTVLETDQWFAPYQIPPNCKTSQLLWLKQKRDQIVCLTRTPLLNWHMQCRSFIAAYVAIFRRRS
jgi:hypothetical protein